MIFRRFKIASLSLLIRLRQISADIEPIPAQAHVGSKHFLNRVPDAPDASLNNANNTYLVSTLSLKPDA